MIPTKGLCSDASFSSKTGLAQWRCVDIKTGKEYFRGQSMGITVNIAEFVGVVEMIKLAVNNPELPRVLYTDSLTSMSWARKLKTNSKIDHHLLRDSLQYLVDNKKEIKRSKVVLRKWMTKQWQTEVYADFELKGKKNKFMSDDERREKM